MLNTKTVAAKQGLTFRVVHVLNLEGLSVFAATLYFYGSLGGNWLWFILFIFAPDFSMLGYLKDNRVGAFFYNLIHTYVLGLSVVVLGRLLNSDFITLTGLVLCAHIGMDRLQGYGLKYISNFKDTHLQHV